MASFNNKYINKQKIQRIKEFFDYRLPILTAIVDGALILLEIFEYVSKQDYFVNAYNNPAYVPDSAVITHVDEFLKLMRVLTGDNRYENISYTEQEKKDGIKMCKVLDFREARGEKRGIEQGIKQGASQLQELMHILAEHGYSIEEILTMTEKEETREALYRQYGII